MPGREEEDWNDFRANESAGAAEDDEWEHEKSHRRSIVWPFIATFMTALAVGHILSLRRRFQDYERMARQAYGRSGAGGSPGNGTSHSSASGSGSGREGFNNGTNGRRTYRYTYWTSDGFRTVKREGYFHKDTGGPDDSWARLFRNGFFDKQELERLERIRRMAEAFQRERAHYARSYEKWQQGGDERTGPRQGVREDWSWSKSDWDAWKNAERSRSQTFQRYSTSPFAQHYRTLGLDELIQSKAGTYSQTDIKAAYRAKAMEYHPDRNQHRKDFAEAKFREVNAAYEALKK